MKALRAAANMVNRDFGRQIIKIISYNIMEDECFGRRRHTKTTNATADDDDDVDATDATRDLDTRKGYYHKRCVAVCR